jgi:feruloyl esterase
MQRAVVSAFSILFLGSAPWVPALAAAADDAKCATLLERVVGDAKIDRAEAVTGGSYKPDDGNAISNLPPFCRLHGVAKPSARSNVQFEVWMPLKDWDGRIHMVGNGGYSPAMNFGQMAALLRSGTVAVATDTGHTGAGDSFEFGFDNDDAIKDWGFRSVHASIVPAKAVVASFYGKAAQRSYFLGCSTGGHQGVVEARHYPDDFDGILAGDPANNRTNLNLSFIARFLAAHPQGDNTRTILQPEDLARVNARAMEQCDALDGVRDGVMANPLACKFDINVMRCAAGQKDGCLDDAKLTALRKMYEPIRRSDTGAEIYTGWPIGSEWLEGGTGGAGLHGYWANPRNPQEPQRVDYLRRWVFKDPKWDWWKFDWAKDVDTAQKRMAPLGDMLETDFSAFAKRGGKMIMYQGWVDPIVSGLDTIRYFEQVQKDNTNAADFTRLFMVPGMGHCSGGPGAGDFTFNMSADADSDAVLALRRWVEEGKPPERIVATKYKDRTRASGVAMTRPLCAWPKVPTYNGSGDTNDAKNFVCK